MKALWVNVLPQYPGQEDKQQEFQDGKAFIISLKTCANRNDLWEGNRLHVDILKSGLLQCNIYVGNTLLHMYMKCGALANAQIVFEELPMWNVSSWNALIAGYAQHGYSDEGLSCFGQMQDKGFPPDVVTFVCVLKACGKVGALEKGKSIHAEVIRLGLLNKNVGLGNALVDMYGKCGQLAIAQNVFDELPVRDVVSWNALISAYTQHSYNDEALNSFVLMQEEGLTPDSVTFTCIIKTCSNMEAIQKGIEVQAEVRRRDLLSKDIVIGNALVAMHVKFGMLAKAQEIFNELPLRNVVSWSVIIMGYALHAQGDEALKCFRMMQDEGIFPNSITFVAILKACCSAGALKKAIEIHAQIVNKLLLEKNIVLGNALIDTYAKSGFIAKAQEVFDELLERDVISWNALITGYVQHGHSADALYCFQLMQDSNVSPDAITFVCILNACGSIGAAEKGEQLHVEVKRKGLAKKNYLLGSALVDMYARCGKLRKAQEVFHELPLYGVLLWNALLAGYAQCGKVELVFGLSKKMKSIGIQPDPVTTTVILASCSHAGLPDEGQIHFEAVSILCDCIPTLEHHLCMVDLFSRAGHFDKAICIIRTVSPSNSLLLWLAFLGTCQRWVNVDLGRWAFQQAVQLDANHCAAYIYMSNICAAGGIIANVEALGRENYGDTLNGLI